MPSLLQPDALSLQIQPGESRTLVVTVTPMGTARFSTLIEGEAFARVTEIAQVKTVRRRLSEDEIRELPPLPPSIREQARLHGVEERFDVRHGPMETVALARGETADIALEFSVPSQTPEGITAASLAVRFSETDVVSVPIFCVVGRAVATPRLEPERMRWALRPGETATRSALIASAPTGDSLVACVVGGRGLIRLTSLVSMRETRRPATDEELAELPTFPPTLREDVRREGIVEYQEAARSNGATPVVVAAGQSVYANLAVAAPAAGMAEIVEADLVIDSPRWERAVLPLRLIVGQISVELLSESVSVTQGHSVELIVTVRSHSGPGDTVHFSFDDDEDRLSVFPASLVIRPGQPTIGKLTVTAGHDAPVGVLQATLVTRAFEQMQVHRSPLRVELQPGGLRVSSQPASLTVRQGDSVTFDLHAFGEGGTKTVVVRPGVLPVGVRIDGAQFTIGPQAGVHTQPMRLFVDLDAPPARQAWTPVAWSAQDGVHAGTLTLPLTIQLKPDVRIFRQQITTPAGTALGGSVELELHNDGTVVFRGHMHGSGFDPYAFRIGYFVRATSMTIALSDVFSSRVGGTLGGGPRDRDWNVVSHSELLREHWRAFRDSRAEFSKWYEDTGVIGTLESFIAPLTEFLLLRVLAGPATAAILVLGPELARITDLPATVPNAIPGAVILGGVVFLFGPLAAVPAVVAGVAVAAAADVKSRRMHASEIAVAEQVFGQTLPIDRIRVTNLVKRRSGTEVAFTVPNLVDNTLLIAMGSGFDRELTHDATFIHELVHAWQHEHRPPSMGSIWSDIAKPFLSDADYMAQYVAVPDGRPWRDFHTEAQASIVEQWYLACGDHQFDSEAARGHPYFPYIANHVRMGIS